MPAVFLWTDRYISNAKRGLCRCVIGTVSRGEAVLGEFSRLGFRLVFSTQARSASEGAAPSTILFPNDHHPKHATSKSVSEAELDTGSASLTLRVKMRLANCCGRAKPRMGIHRADHLAD